MVLNLILGDIDFEISIYGLSFKSMYYRGAGGLSSKVPNLGNANCEYMPNKK